MRPCLLDKGLGRARIQHDKLRCKGRLGVRGSVLRVSWPLMARSLFFTFAQILQGAVAKSSLLLLHPPEPASLGMRTAQSRSA